MIKYLVNIRNLLSNGLGFIINLLRLNTHIKDIKGINNKPIKNSKNAHSLKGIESSNINKNINTDNNKNFKRLSETKSTDQNKLNHGLGKRQKNKSGIT